MTALKILTGLETIDATGAEADTVARLGFLEWAFCQQGYATPEAARAALRTVAMTTPSSEAACAFVSFLEEATRMVYRPGKRRGRAPRLH